MNGLQHNTLTSMLQQGHQLNPTAITSMDSKPPAHFFSNSFNDNEDDNRLRMMILSHQRKRNLQSHLSAAVLVLGTAPTHTDTAAKCVWTASDLVLNTNERMHRDEMCILQMMAAKKQKEREAIPPIVSIPHAPPPALVMKEEGNLKGNDEASSRSRSETIERVLAFQEAQARRERDIEAEQLRQLEMIQAANQRRRLLEMEKDMLLAEQQRQRRLLSQHLNPTYPTTTLGFDKEMSSSEVEDEETKLVARLSMIQSAKLAKLQSISSTTASPSQTLTSTLTNDKLLGLKGTLPQSKFLSNGSAQTHQVLGLQKLREIEILHALRRQKMLYHTAVPQMQYQYERLETPSAKLHPSQLHRLNSTRSAATVTVSSTPTEISNTLTSASTISLPLSNDDNIISTFSNLVVTSIPEVIASVSNLLLDIMQIRGYPSDPLIVNSKFPGFVGSVLLELKSLGERSKDKKELYDRVTKCVAAIEPYTEMSELGTPSGKYWQIRAIVKEGTERASALILDDPSERRAIEKRRRKGGKDEQKEASPAKKRPRYASISEKIDIDILEMYKNHRKSNAE